jgi:anti-sigma regulatory factor (Ser/Thr protein kinase)
MRQNTKIMRDFIINNVQSTPVALSNLVAEKFGISVQAALAHMKDLFEDGILSSEGNTRGKRYFLATKKYEYHYIKIAALSESSVWARDVSKHFSDVPENVRKIWDYVFSEIFNNAIDHSNATNINIYIEQNILDTTLKICDNGIGIFNKIRKFLELPDNREVAIELAKGKFTTDKDNHTGEGLFFSSRAMDRFMILSYGASWSHDYEKSDWVFDENFDTEYKGTCVEMRLSNTSDRKLADVFNKYGNPDFDTTIIPVVLMTNSGEGLVSRSQARRVLARIENFKNVYFDFAGVTGIGQAFADEIFRVFKRRNRNINLHVVNANSDVQSMVTRAENNNSGDY